jgi:hypothetical protein
MAFVHLSDLKDYGDSLSTASRTTVSSGFRVKDHTKLPRLHDRSSCVMCSGFTQSGRPCKKATLNRSGFCNNHETAEIKAAAFLLMCDQALEALDDFPKIPEIPNPEPIIKDPIPDKPIVKEIPTATPVNQVHIHYSLSGLMKQINIFITYCVILFAMYMYGKSMHASDELVCLPAPHAAPAPPSVMLGW